MNTTSRLSSGPTRTLAALAAGAILLTGCGAGSTSESRPEVAPVPAAGAASDRDSAGGAGAPAGGGPFKPGVEGATPLATGVERQITRTASLTMVVDDVQATAERIRAITPTLEGCVTNESLSLSGDSVKIRPAGSSLTLSVPASRLDEAITKVGELGVVRDRNASAEDVTDVVVDLDARITSLEASVTRLQELVQRAGSVADIAAVERELASRQADLEAMKSQRLRLAGAVERSTLTVALLTPTQSTTTNPIQTGWSQGWTAFLTSLSFLITFVAALLPFALFAGLVAAPILWWLRAHKRRRARQAAQQSAARASGDVGLEPVDVPARQEDGPGEEPQRDGDADQRP